MNATAPIMIMAGGTGGHVFPGLAVAERLRARQIPLVWLGTRRGLEARLVPQAGIEIEWIGVAGLRGKGFKGLLAAPFMLAKALFQATRILRRRRPRLVLGLGGFVSGPGGLMARVFGIPLIIHEQNAVVGLTNRCLARLAKQVLQAFPGSFPSASKPLTVGNPVRAEIAAVAAPGERWQQRSGPMRLLILGGSQGALALNRLLPEALALLTPQQRPLVRHQAGGKWYDTALTAYRAADIEAEVVPFIDDMAAAYAWADLIICRSGALTVAELAAAGVGAILVPFPYAVDDHQTANARFLERGGAAVVLAQSELNSSVLAGHLGHLLADRVGLLAMAEAARRLAQPDAAEQVAMHCMAYGESA